MDSARDGSQHLKRILVSDNGFCDGAGAKLYAGDGGSFPECHVAQYPLGMGKKKVRKFFKSARCF